MAIAGRVLITSRSVFKKIVSNTSVISRFTASSVCQNSFAPQNFLHTGSTQFAEKKFSKKHEWVSLDGKIGTVGISQYAQESLGDVVYVQMPEIGSEFSQDDECGAVESVKAASEIYTPVSGKVTEVNSELEDNPALVNQSCYDKGWLFRLELSKLPEYDDLLTEEQYCKYLKTLE